MSSHQRSASQAGSSEKTYFEQQREALIGEIAMSFEHVLANINKLNRSLEAVTAVGHEFSSVEALWSQFENVMAKEEQQQQGGSGGDGDAEGARKEEEEVTKGEGEGDGEGQNDGDNYAREDDAIPARSTARG